MNGISCITKTDYCPTMSSWAKNEGLKVAWSGVKAGDLVLFDFNRNGTADHIGLVYKVGDGVVYTVEGNTGSGSQTNGGQVQRRIRKKSENCVLHFARPKYTLELTKGMVLAAALCEVGTVESPRNSNKVKYNDWFYGKTGASAYWCSTYVSWCFAHMRTKPTGHYTGKLTTESLSKGSKGDGVMALQKFLNWYFGHNLATDGDFGATTENIVMAFQALEGLGIDGAFGPKSISAASVYSDVKEVAVKENGRTIIATLTAQTRLEMQTAYVDQSLAVKSSTERVVFAAKRDGAAHIATVYTATDKGRRVGMTGLGHANGACYCPDKDAYYVCSYYGSTNLKKVTKLDANTLMKTESFNLSVAVSGIAYDRVYKKFAGSKGKRVYLFDKNFKKTGSFVLKFADGTPQDIFINEGYVYACRSYVSGSKSYIDVYTSAGAYRGSYKVTANELESADIDENGYIHYLTWNKAELVKTKVKVK